MAHNPELDYEFREGKQNQKPKPIIYRDHDGYSEPFEQLAAMKEMGGNTRSLLLKIAGAVLVLVACGWLYSLLPQ